MRKNILEAGAEASHVIVSWLHLCVSLHAESACYEPNFVSVICAIPDAPNLHGFDARQILIIISFLLY